MAPGVVGQGMGLAVIHHLQVVFDGAQEDIAIRQHAVLADRQQVRLSGSAPAPSSVLGLRILARASAAARRTPAAKTAPQIPHRGSSLRPASHRPTRALLLQRRLRCAVSWRTHPRASTPTGSPNNSGRTLLQEVFPHRRVPGHQARLEQGLFFPQQGVLLQIGQVTHPTEETSGPTLPHGRRRISTR